MIDLDLVFSCKQYEGPGGRGTGGRGPGVVDLGVWEYRKKNNSHNNIFQREYLTLGGCFGPKRKLHKNKQQ